MFVYCRIDGGSPVHTSRVMSSTSFCVAPHTPAGSAGARSDLLRSVHNRSTQLTAVSDTSPSRASPANSGSSPRDSQASVTSTDSSSSPRVSGAKDAAGLIELSQQVSNNCYGAFTLRRCTTKLVNIAELKKLCCWQYGTIWCKSSLIVPQSYHFATDLNRVLLDLVEIMNTRFKYWANYGRLTIVTEMFQMLTKSCPKFVVIFVNIFHA